MTNLFSLRIFIYILLYLIIPVCVKVSMTSSRHFNSYLKKTIMQNEKANKCSWPDIMLTHIELYINQEIARYKKCPTFPKDSSQPLLIITPEKPEKRNGLCSHVLKVNSGPRCRTLIPQFRTL